MEKRKTLIETHDLMFFYNPETVILKNINLKVYEGEFISILGSSGSGKTTLLSLLAGLDNPKGGEVILLGKNVSDIKEKDMSILRRTKLGYVFQFFNLAPYLTIEENILIPIYLNHEKKNKYKEKLESLLDFLSLKNRRKAYPNDCSGGEQQRAAIARSLIYSPSLIFLDEPTGNLDSENSKNLMILLKRINDEKGVTIVQVTHSEENAKYGKRIIRLKDGEILNDYTL